jgi:NTP pyrophosphatase (non-canonical NTP hydrolase)
MSKADTMLFYAEFNGMQTAVHRTAVSKGWWDSPRSGGAKFCNLHGHVSDALEQARKAPEPASPLEAGAQTALQVSRLEIGIESSLAHLKAGIPVPAELEEFGTCIALMHSELSEAWTDVWAHNQDTGQTNFPQSLKIPEFSTVEEEFADVIIRIMDYSERKGLDVAGAIVAKAEYNKSRSQRHGDKSF